MFRLLLFNILIVLSYINSCTSSSKPSVIIIGAGPAGIAAATRLLENSITNIKIFEAQNRIGGRIHSVKFKDSIVDLGAEFCHGKKDNIVYELAKDVLKPAVNTLEKDVFYSNGSRLDPRFVWDIQSAISLYDVNVDETYNTTSKSVGDLFIHSYENTVLKKYKDDPQKLKISKEGLRFSEGLITSIDGSFSWYRSSAESDYKDCEGGDFIWDGHGFKTILDLLMKSYPIDDKTFLNTKVTKISWNDTLTVLTFDNTSYSADYVIFTPSVGVLKAKKDSLFHPQLPQAKLNAIEAIGIDAVMKVFLHFPVKWWDHKDEQFFFFWGDEDLEAAVLHHGLNWVTHFAYVTETYQNPNVLTAWFTGEIIPEVEKLPEETLKKGCLYVLRKFLGKRYNVTEIGEILRSTWYSNENVLGSYSYMKAGYYNKELSHQLQLGQPLRNKAGKASLLFAGEATSPNRYGTVNGAIETGYREADRIIDLEKKEK